jgi:hypothetical protein
MFWAVGALRPFYSSGVGGVKGFSKKQSVFGFLGGGLLPLFLVFYIK